ncbi:hypothetical protein NKJ86_13820 [Mesorhizobium sp. M0025]|uniref:hypothetical protein n=1 Tax=Mesorhizobium sp. M0025 TaxID=2956846 RepID=UPI00333D73FC
MSRTAIVVVFLISLLLVAGGGFLVGNAMLVPSQDISGVAESILDEAKQRVPEPTLPPKPGGREEKVTVPVTRTIQVPKIEMKGNGIFRTPQVVMTTQTITESVEQVKIVDASPAEIASWDAKVKSIRDDYGRKLDAEIKKISQEEKLKNMRETAAIIKDMINTAIIPLLAALAGLVGALITLRNAFRSSPPVPNTPDSAH